MGVTGVSIFISKGQIRVMVVQHGMLHYADIFACLYEPQKKRSKIEKIHEKKQKTQLFTEYCYCRC